MLINGRLVIGATHFVGLTKFKLVGKIEFEMDHETVEAIALNAQGKNKQVILQGGISHDNHYCKNIYEGQCMDDS